MSGRVGGLSKINYKETRGVKVSGGMRVKSGTVLTRQGDKWKPGVNVLGRMHLTAACEGTVYFTRKKGNYKRAVTFINVKPLEQKSVSKRPVSPKKNTKKKVSEK